MRNYIILCSLLAIASCGGGGGVSASTPTQATSTPTTVPATSTAATCDDACFQAKKDDFEALYEYSTQ